MNHRVYVLFPVILAGLMFASARADQPQSEPGSLYVEGYTDQLSYQAGDDIKFRVSTTAPTWSLEISRLVQKRNRFGSRAICPAPRTRSPPMLLRRAAAGPRRFRSWRPSLAQRIL